jgi:hypothetical protein
MTKANQSGEVLIIIPKDHSIIAFGIKWFSNLLLRLTL